MTNELREKIERWTILAESLLNTDTRAFIIDYNDSYFFCDLIFVGKDKIMFKPFKGNNEGIKTTKFWGQIKDLKEYKER